MSDKNQAKERLAPAEKCPVIGISCGINYAEGDYALRAAYVESVLSAGACPLILPAHADLRQAEQVASLLDGLLLSGGGDIDPRFFGQEPMRGLGRTDAERDRFELVLTRRVQSLGLPILGICRGVQVLNVALGGEIYQDLKYAEPQGMSFTEHFQQSPRHHTCHSVDIISEELLAMTGSRCFFVNSFHHQALAVLAEPLKVAARSKDGVIEAVTGTGGGFCLGVQWHPEWLKTKESEGIFRAFINAAAAQEL